MVKAHLHLLSRLAFALRNPEFKALIVKQAGRDEILASARRISDSLRVPVNATQKEAVRLMWLLFAMAILLLGAMAVLVLSRPDRNVSWLGAGSVVIASALGCVPVIQVLSRRFNRSRARALAGAFRGILS